MGKQYLSPKEFVARLEASGLDVSVHWVYRRIQSGEIRAGRLGGRHRIPASEAARIEHELADQCGEVGESAVQGGR